MDIINWELVKGRKKNGVGTKWGGRKGRYRD